LPAMSYACTSPAFFLVAMVRRRELETWSQLPHPGPRFPSDFAPNHTLNYPPLINARGGKRSLFYFGVGNFGFSCICVTVGAQHYFLPLPSITHPTYSSQFVAVLEHSLHSACFQSGQTRDYYCSASLLFLFSPVLTTHYLTHCLARPAYSGSHSSTSTCQASRVPSWSLLGQCRSIACWSFPRPLVDYCVCYFPQPSLVAAEGHRDGGRRVLCSTSWASSLAQFRHLHSGLVRCVAGSEPCLRWAQ